MSNATQPSESDFHDSHPVSGSATDPKTKEASQAIGDLTSIENEADIPASHNIDLTGIDESQSEILGDISLLDEAFAEMEDTGLPIDAQTKPAVEANSEALNNNTDENIDKNTASKLASGIASGVASGVASGLASEIAAASDEEIPVLNESIDAPNESKIIPPQTMAASVPLLNEEATAFAEMLKPASSKTNKTHSEVISSTSAIPSASPTEHIISEPVITPDASAPESKIISELAAAEEAAPSSASKIPSEPLFDSEDAQSNANISELNNSLAMAAEMMSEAVPSGLLSEFSADDAASEKNTALEEQKGESNLIPDLGSELNSELNSELISDLSPDLSPDLNDAALEALLAEDDDAQSHINSKIDSGVSSEINNEVISPPVTSIIGEETEKSEEYLSEFSMGTTSIDEKIALATSHSTFEINEHPLGALSEPSEFPSNFAEDLIGSQSSTFNNSDLNSMEISEFNADEDLKSVAQASHSVGITGIGNRQEQAQNQAQAQGKNNLNINIPFELHSQLSQKIDELVIDATSSITEELHTQLTSRLDTLLGNAVESVLPKLVNQMAIELRNEINDKVKQQLPNIINDVLNKTRLQK